MNDFHASRFQQNMMKHLLQVSIFWPGLGVPIALFPRRLFANNSEERSLPEGEAGHFTYQASWECIPKNWFIFRTDYGIASFVADILEGTLIFLSLVEKTGTMNSFAAVNPSDLADIMGMAHWRAATLRASCCKPQWT
ncbi:hypothetical protein MPER_13086 [Moniliophthora perniciosa FA553]|nr:hypothetical protein MPER_13086 [Moniliophthora perniciosa FA553]